MQVCTLLQPDNHTTQFFMGWMPFLSPNQQRQSTEGKANTNSPSIYMNAPQSIRLQK